MIFQKQYLKIKKLLRKSSNLRVKYQSKNKKKKVFRNHLKKIQIKSVIQLMQSNHTSKSQKNNQFNKKIVLIINNKKKSKIVKK